MTTNAKFQLDEQMLINADKMAHTHGLNITQFTAANCNNSNMKYNCGHSSATETNNHGT